MLIFIEDYQHREQLRMLVTWAMHLALCMGLQLVFSAKSPQIAMGAKSSIGVLGTTPLSSAERPTTGGSENALGRQSAGGESGSMGSR